MLGPIHLYLFAEYVSARVPIEGPAPGTADVPAAEVGQSLATIVAQRVEVGVTSSTGSTVLIRVTGLDWMKERSPKDQALGLRYHRRRRGLARADWLGGQVLGRPDQHRPQRGKARAETDSGQAIMLDRPQKAALDFAAHLAGARLFALGLELAVLKEG